MTITLPLVAQEPYELDTMTITEQPGDNDRFLLDPTRGIITRPGTTELLKRVPGANVNFNGPLSGIAQYRGMFGNRINVLVDGQYINPGCSNDMDPPLHYMPRPRVGELEVFRGIAPLSSGLETIGGTVIANSRRGKFGATEAFKPSGYVEGGGQRVDSGYSVGGLISLANTRHRIDFGGSREDGDDTEFGAGTIADTAYQRNTYDVGYGFRSGAQEIGIKWLHNDTNETGTPALPMDIDFFDSDIVSGDYHGEIAGLTLDAKLSHTKIDHRMTNFGSREPPPDPARFRFADSNSSAWYYILKTQKPLFRGQLTFGADGDLADHEATIFNPNNADFFVDNFNDVNRDRYGIFTEWRGPIQGNWGGEWGLRYTRVEMDAGAVDATPARMMAGPQSLRDRFNSAERDRSDNNFDALAKINYRFRPEVKAELGIARKTRSPWYQERYLWLPLEATGGLADGNNYVGNLDLETEASYQVELALDWRTVDFYFSPQIFYRRVDDYIQGTPSTDPVVIIVSTANGDATPLQFNNVDAEFYGFDLEMGLQISRNWHLDGLLSFVRGERRDISDNLYRIAPPNGTLALTYDRANWATTIEGEFYAKQDKVSATNEETPSAGYGLFNLRGQYALVEGNVASATLHAGVDNVLDKTYSPHLNGSNRVANSDVALGQRLPGAGRNFYARLNVEF